MDFKEYQNKARETAIYPYVGNNIEYPTLGLCGEAGEIANKVKKIKRDYEGYMTKEIREALIHELGDVLWYLAMVANEAGLSLDYIAMLNVKMLKDRQDKDKLHGSGDDR